jgi:ABC-2 type transport system permease protein
MPPILHHIAIINPLSYMVDAVRSLIVSGDLNNLPVDILAIDVFDMVAFTIATLNFRRIVE